MPREQAVMIFAKEIAPGDIVRPVGRRQLNDKIYVAKAPGSVRRVTIDGLHLTIDGVRVALPDIDVVVVRDTVTRHHVFPVMTEMRRVGRPV